MVSVMRKLHFLITLAWVQVNLMLPTTFTDCLLYPITLTSPQGFNSRLPLSFWFNWSYTFNGITLISAPVSCLPHISTPFISIFEKIWVGGLTSTVVWCVEVDNILSSKWYHKFLPEIILLLAKLTTSSTCFGTVFVIFPCTVFLEIDIKELSWSWFSSLTDVCLPGDLDLNEDLL